MHIAEVGKTGRNVVLRDRVRVVKRAVQSGNEASSRADLRPTD
jgi:hypothetical protein